MPLIEPRPDTVPVTVDATPVGCDECGPVNNQKMVKMTVRDFVSVKKKIAELDEYSTYLIGIIEDIAK